MSACRVGNHRLSTDRPSDMSFRILLAVVAVVVTSACGSSEEAGGGTDATPTVPPTQQTKEVAYNGLRFDVPGRLPVSEPSPYDFHCGTSDEDGVFLAPQVARR